MSNKNSRDHGIDRYHDMAPDADRTQQLKKIYADWAASYDHDNDHRLGTVSQPNAVALLSQHLENKDAEILDVGCGTGLVGMHLIKAGYQNFDGTDLTDEMLQVAQSRGYRSLVQSDAGSGLPFKDDTYDATLCVGVFTHGHVSPDLIDELIRVTRAGGLIVFTVNEGVWELEGFDLAIDSRTHACKWDLLAKIKQPYMVKEDVEGWYIAAQKPL